MTPRRPGPLLRRLLRAPARLYDWNLGWLLGHRFLRLTHTGRRSGRSYETVLEVVGTTPAGEVLVMAGLGARADWLRNLAATPRARVAIGRDRFPATYRLLPPAEALLALRDYERRNRLVAPILRRALSWLVGWHYDGTDAARERLVEQLPVVAFRRANGA